MLDDTEHLNRHARHGMWQAALNGDTCFVLVVDDLDDENDPESNYKSVIQLSDWDGRPAMSSRVFDADDVLCQHAKWLGDATLMLTSRLSDTVPRAHVGQIYVHRGRPYLLVLDDLARLREHALVGIHHHGNDDDGFYEWELHYESTLTLPHEVRVQTSSEIDSWINDWSPPSDATALSRLR